jgi:hypothetical protein
MRTLTKTPRRLAATAATTAVASLGLIVPMTAAHATTIDTITQSSNRIDFSETRATGHNDWTGDGLLVRTEGSTSTDKAAGYWACNFALADITNVSSDIYFHDPAHLAVPGSQSVIDFDHNGTPDGILVGEPVYGNDFWLSNGSAQFVKDGAPHDGGGFGSEWYGTLAEWAQAFPGALYTNCGYSLGSGVQGDVEIKSMTFGDTQYRFTNITPPPTPVAPVGHVSETHACRTITVSESVDALGPDQVAQPATVAFRVLDNGKQVQSVSLAPGQSAQYSHTYPKNSKHRIKVLQDGVQKLLVKVVTNC